MSSNESDLQEDIKDLKVNDTRDINILLLGETGVGKSTFINSVANYLTHTDLKTAEQEELLVLIPSKYEITDRHGIQHTVQIGSEDDTNEYLDTGMSATQDVRTYVFPILDGRINVRLIDTPGIGDTRGMEQDNINYENILSYIGQLDELHAICFMLKPTNTRLTVYFKYCMYQILSRLEKSASKNIIFVLTNTRGTDYGPGETRANLRIAINEVKSRPPHVDIPLNKNIFCFDNEAIKYLAAVKQGGIEFNNAVILRNRESWQKSAERCWRLINYIVGDEKNPPLKPHCIKNTSAINEARRIITQLSQPLAEIAQLINDNLSILQRHEDNLNLDKNTLQELKKKLYMPVINLEVTELTQPVTVCAGPRCREPYTVGDATKYHYKQRCHDPCYLKDVPKEIIGDPALIRCLAMNNSKTCSKCECSYSTHMHIYYTTTTKEDKIVDANVQKNISNKEKVLQKANQLISNILKRKKELEEEHDVIVTCSARFAHFLQNNAITPYNDAYKSYIEYLIDNEKSLGVACNRDAVIYLEKLLREYEEAKKSFDEALKMQNKLGDSDVHITPQKIQDSIQQLYRLKHNGKKIKELYECQNTSRRKEHTFTEYVHKVISKLGRKIKNKKKGKLHSPPPTYQEANCQGPSSSQSHHPPPGNYEEYPPLVSQGPGPCLSAPDRTPYPPAASHDPYSDSHSTKDADATDVIQETGNKSEQSCQEN